MDEPSKGDVFRKQSTALYSVVCVALVGLVVLSTVAGWYFGGWLWFIIAGVVTGVIAIAIGLGATMIWVMTQDGA